ncbi:hypothetical protein [Streptomyces bullii]|uniref:Uncharacterized protein n=1 Tax=Streptomyces bullii TaxID=349910 RepID=A0ABW0USX8_9ACTN
MQIPVERAEAFYLPPPSEPAEAWALVPPAERVFRWVELRQQRRITPPDGFLIGQRLYARINHNRWVADCPCGSAQVVTPVDPRFACTECGYGWVTLIFPVDVDAAEASVAEELPHLRNWWHSDDPDPWGHPPSDAPADPATESTAEPAREVPQ